MQRPSLSHSFLSIWRVISELTGSGLSSTFLNVNKLYLNLSAQSYCSVCAIWLAQGAQIGWACSAWKSFEAKHRRPHFLSAVWNIMTGCSAEYTILESRFLSRSFCKRQWSYLIPFAPCTLAHLSPSDSPSLESLHLPPLQFPVFSAE